MKFNIGDKVMVSCCNEDIPAVITGYDSIDQMYDITFDDGAEGFYFIESELKLIEFENCYII